ncbi:ribonuclease H-like domain-containing protein [Tanacetum coccineum]
MSKKNLNTSVTNFYLSENEWEVIQKGNGPVSVLTDTNGVIKVLPPKTTEEILARERERKARTTLLMALAEDHLAKFHKMTYAKDMWDAIKSRFGGNDESKKMHKYILKQQFEGFFVSNSEGLHKGYDRFQRLLSQLEIHSAGVSTKDVNQKFLRSLPSSWSQVSLVMRTKLGVDSLSIDYLYNNHRVFESDIKGSTGSSSSAQNVAFVSSESTSSNNEVSTAYGVSTSSGYNSQRENSSSYTDELILNKFYKKTGRKLHFDAKEPVGFDKTEERPSFAFVNTVKHVKTPREIVKEQNSYSLSPKADKYDWNGLMSKRLGLGYGFTKKACFVYGHFSHLIRDCDFHEKRIAKHVKLNKKKGKGTGQGENRPVWNNVQRLNHQNQFVPTAVLTRTGRIPVNTASHNFNSQAVSTSAARKVNVVRPIVNENRPRNNFHKTHSPIRRPFNRTTTPRTNFSNQKVNTAEVKAVSVVGGKRETAVKPSAGCNWRPKRHYWNKFSKYNGGSNSRKCDNPQRALKNKEIVDSGCSKHMTGNKAYLIEYQDYNGGLVAFECSKGYITGKGKIKTGKLDFEDVCFVKELHHFNLFSVSQMCDKKNKATIDESNKWHRRLGHVNFKKGNLVRSLPAKIFQNDCTYVACQKGKQHKASALLVSPYNFYIWTYWDLHLSKGIKREYSNARTPQQNGVAERKNRTLIEAARTMVLVTKPQNKTPYELITGKTPIISFIRPFGYHVTILNTIDHLGKFERKSDEGFLPVRSENQANKTACPKEAYHSAGTQENNDAGNSEMETESAQDYFVWTIWSSYTSTVKSSEAKNEDEKTNKNTGLKTNKKPGSGDKGESTEELVSIAVPKTVSTARPELSTARPELSTPRPDVDAARQEDSAIEP